MSTTSGSCPPSNVHSVVAASAEGYAFPTNLDHDQPIGGLTPQTEAELVLQALAEDWSVETFAAARRRQQERRSRHQDAQRLTGPA